MVPNLREEVVSISAYAAMTVEPKYKESFRDRTLQYVIPQPDINHADDDGLDHEPIHRGRIEDIIDLLYYFSQNICSSMCTVTHVLLLRK